MKDYFPGNLGGNDKRFTRNNRNYDTTLTRNLDTRNGNYRNNGYQRKKSGQDVAAEALNENLNVIKTHLQTISDVQKRMAEAQERRATAEERNAIAMERIAEHLMQLLNNHSVAPVAENTFPEKTVVQNTPEERPADQDAKRTLAIISEMRQGGASYDKIAENLIEAGVPTLSGKGHWNRKMVSRINQAPVN